MAIRVVRGLLANGRCSRPGAHAGSIPASVIQAWSIFMPLKPLDRRTFLRLRPASASACRCSTRCCRPSSRKTSVNRRRGAWFSSAGRSGCIRRFSSPRSRAAITSTPVTPGVLDAHRAQFTVFSGMSHRGYTEGHHNDVALFTEAFKPEGIRPQRCPQHHLARSGSRHAHRQPGRASASLVSRRHRLFVESPRSVSAGYFVGEQRLSADVHPGHARRDRPRGAPPARRPQHPRRPAGPGACAVRDPRGRGPGSARPVPDVDSRSGAAAQPGRGLGPSPQAAGHRSRADEDDVHSPPANSWLARGNGTTWSISPCRPIRRGSSPCRSPRRNSR